MSRADLLTQISEADAALATAEATLAGIRQAERRAAAEVNRAAVIAGALHRALEAADELAPYVFHGAREGATTYT